MLSLDFIPNSGGVAAHVYELSKSLVKSGNIITVLTINRWNNKFINKKTIDGINVVSFLRMIESLVLISTLKSSNWSFLISFMFD